MCFGIIVTDGKGNALGTRAWHDTMSPYMYLRAAISVQSEVGDNSANTDRRHRNYRRNLNKYVCRRSSVHQPAVPLVLAACLACTRALRIFGATTAYAGAICELSTSRAAAAASAHGTATSTEIAVGLLASNELQRRCRRLKMIG